MGNFKINAEDIYLATEGGKTVITHFYPSSATGFSGRRNFRLRPDDKNPSGTVFLSEDGHWLLQDKGGADTRAYNAITLTMREMGLNYPQAIEWIAQTFAPELLEDRDSGSSVAPQADCEEVAPVDAITVQFRKGGRFTVRELEVLGHMVTDPDGSTHPFITPEDCEALCLRPLDSYTTARNQKGKSYRFSGNEGFPMYAYDYKTYGKIYQPFHPKYRFLWYGSQKDKQAMPLSGEREFMDRYAQALRGEWEPVTYIQDEDGKKQQLDNKWDKLVICSGPSDALNVHHAGYHVCWPNSETADITEYQMKILQDMTHELYILYDIDETGIRNMYKIALQYLGVKIIRLPDELKQRRARNGKPCKDAKDFFSYFRKPEIQNPVRLFNDLVRLSGGLQFWTRIRCKDGSYRYDINNEQLYAFLEASGFHTIDTTSTKEGFTFCRVTDNVVTLIDKDAIAGECTRYLLEYLRTHPKYYYQELSNAIYRTTQISASALTMLSRIHPNFDAFNEEWDYFFFQNKIVRAGARGVETVNPSDCPYMVYADKIIPHDFKPEPAFFDISATPAFSDLKRQLDELTPQTPQWFAVKRQIDTMDDMDKYRLKVESWGTTFMQYLYNTGRTYWRKEEAGYALNDQERMEVDRNFMAKSLALGYMLSKHKNSGQPYAVYAMEMTQGEDGEHLGGTGKSMFLMSIEQLRRQHYVDAQKLQEDKMQFMLQGVVRGVTDTVFMDDVNNRIDLHLFMNMVTGKMVVDVKHANPFTLSFQESPKIGFTSNHAITRFDDSLNRRIWFAAFSDYYHSDSDARGLKLRSPRTEFGKDLIDQYSEAEMAHFFTFMLNCVSVWHKIHERVQPPMAEIVRRTLVKEMSEDFMWWADEYFTAERLDTLVDQDEARNDCCERLSRRSSDFMTMRKFRQRLQTYCRYKDWKFNPPQILRSMSDYNDNRVHRKVNGQDHYYFYIQTQNGVSPDTPEPPQGGAGNADDDMPPFK